MTATGWNIVIGACELDDEWPRGSVLVLGNGVLLARAGLYVFYCHVERQAWPGQAPCRAAAYGATTQIVGPRLVSIASPHMMAQYLKILLLHWSRPPEIRYLLNGTLTNGNSTQDVPGDRRHLTDGHGCHVPGTLWLRARGRGPSWKWLCKEPDTSVFRASHPPSCCSGSPLGRGGRHVRPPASLSSCVRHEYAVPHRRRAHTRPGRVLRTRRAS
jgi:hypothetical protein